MIRHGIYPQPTLEEMAHDYVFKCLIPRKQTLDPKEAGRLSTLGWNQKQEMLRRFGFDDQLVYDAIDKALDMAELIGL